MLQPKARRRKVFAPSLIVVKVLWLGRRYASPFCSNCRSRLLENKVRSDVNRQM
jgi:hypothetical protein